MRRFIKLYFKFIVQYLKILLQSKMDFFIGVIGFICSQIFSIISLLIIFNSISSLNGWKIHEVLFLYGFFLIPKGLDHFFTDNLWTVAWFQIKDGSFDRYLLRPAGVLFQILSEKIQFDGLGELILGTLIVCKVLVTRSIGFDVEKILVLIVLCIISAIVFSSLKLLFTSFAFFMKESGEIVEMLYLIGDFSKYPISIYPRLIKLFLIYVLPFAWVSYFPVCYLLGKGVGIEIFFQEFLVMIITLLFSLFVFKLGLKKYESVGN